MELGEELQLRIDTDLQILASRFLSHHSADGNLIKHRKKEIVEKQLAAERDRAKNGSPFYSLDQHLKLLTQLRNLKELE